VFLAYLDLPSITPNATVVIILVVHSANMSEEVQFSFNHSLKIFTVTQIESSLTSASVILLLSLATIIMTIIIIIIIFSAL